jgi:glycerol 3-phosphatase-1
MLTNDASGTIIDSTPAIVKHWQRWVQRHMLCAKAYLLYRIGKEIGVDPEVILATSHGRRSIDVLKIYEPKLANWECKGSWSITCQEDMLSIGNRY